MLIFADAAHVELGLDMMKTFVVCCCQIFSHLVNLLSSFSKIILVVLGSLMTAYINGSVCFLA